MGVSSIGAVAPTPQPIVFQNIPTAASSVGVTGLQAFNDRQIPAGKWNMQVIFQAYATAYSTGTPTWQSYLPTQVRFYSFATDKPILTLSINTILDRQSAFFVLPEACYFDLQIDGTGSPRVDVIFHPADNGLPITTEGICSLLGPTETPPTSSNTSLDWVPGGFIASGGIQFVGFDYDNNTLAIITPRTTSVPSAAFKIVRSVSVQRLTSGSTRYSNPVVLTWNNSNAWFSGHPGFDINYDSGTVFFIKDNELHCLSKYGIYDDGTTVSGWAKASCSVTASVNLTLGNTNANFNAPKASLRAAQSGNEPPFAYYHDVINGKVIYLGFRNQNANATAFSPRWSQWDIRTNVNDYTSTFSNQPLYPNNDLDYIVTNLDAWVPDGATGRAYHLAHSQNIAKAVSAGIFTQSGIFSFQYPSNVYASGNPQVFPVTTNTGSTPMRSNNSFIYNGKFYGGDTNQIMAVVSEDITSATSAAAVTNTYWTYPGQTLGSNRYNRNVQGRGISAANYDTWGYYVTSQKIYLINAGQAVSTRNHSTKLYTGNLVTKVYSMPTSDLNLRRLLVLTGGIKTPTSQFQVY
jgi:hypothetical protein